jgi:hypothetical protein
VIERRRQNGREEQERGPIGNERLSELQPGFQAQRVAIHLKGHGFVLRYQRYISMTADGEK